MLSATLLTMIVLPVLYRLFGRGTNAATNDVHQSVSPLPEAEPALAH
jgi:hypothetical protein